MDRLSARATTVVPVLPTTRVRATCARAQLSSPGKIARRVWGLRSQRSPSTHSTASTAPPTPALKGSTKCWQRRQVPTPTSQSAAQHVSWLRKLLHVVTLILTSGQCCRPMHDPCPCASSCGPSLHARVRLRRSNLDRLRQRLPTRMRSYDGYDVCRHVCCGVPVPTRSDLGPRRSVCQRRRMLRVLGRSTATVNQAWG